MRNEKRVCPHYLNTVEKIEEVWEVEKAWYKGQRIKEKGCVPQFQKITGREHAGQSAHMHTQTHTRVDTLPSQLYSPHTFVFLLTLLLPDFCFSELGLLYLGVDYLGTIIVRCKLKIWWNCLYKPQTQISDESALACIIYDIVLSTLQIFYSLCNLVTTDSEHMARQIATGCICCSICS